jgi:hypothetical protein
MPPFLPWDFLVACFGQSEFFFYQGVRHVHAKSMPRTVLQCPRIGLRLMSLDGTGHRNFSQVQGGTISALNVDGVAVSEKSSN